MHNINMENGWDPVPSTEGLGVQLLSGDFDETQAKGHRTRLVRFQPGGQTFEPYQHDYWEEVYLLSGEVTTPENGVTLNAPAYVLRPPHTPHGPFLSRNGCLMLEIQYFSGRSKGLTTYLDQKAPQG